MADESYEASERRRLSEEIERLRVVDIPAANVLHKQLEDELKATLLLIPGLVSIINAKKDQMAEIVGHLGGKVYNVDVDTSGVQFQLRDLETKYFNLKRVSEASINLTALQKEHGSKFGHYDKLRKISLGYIIGVDTHIISKDLARKMVEKSFLECNYWLPYAIMAVTQWVANNKSNCELAIKNSLYNNYLNSCLFYLFTCLRFGRIDSAKKWFLAYLDKVDVLNMGNEWQYVLQAYLYGVFGVEKEFKESVEDYIQNLFNKIYLTTVDFNEKFEEKAYKYIKGLPNKTEKEFVKLNQYCEEYDDLIKYLSFIEKYKLVYDNYNKLLNYEELDSGRLAQKIENVLYSLVNSYEDKELTLVQQMKYNEFIINSKGDTKYAQESYNELFPEADEGKNFGTLLLDWAFAGEHDNVDPWVQKFAIYSMKESIVRGFSKYCDEVEKLNVEKVTFNIDNCHIECDENGFDEGCKTIDKQYYKIRAKRIWQDKDVRIYGIVSLIAIALLVLQFFTFYPTILTFGILGLVGSGLLIWKRATDIIFEIEQLKNATIKKFKDVLEDLKGWRAICKKSVKFGSSLLDIIKNF